MCCHCELTLFKLVSVSANVTCAMKRRKEICIIYLKLIDICTTNKYYTEYMKHICNFRSTLHEMDTCINILESSRKCANGTLFLGNLI